MTVQNTTKNTPALAHVGGCHFRAPCVIIVPNNFFRRNLDGIKKISIFADASQPERPMPTGIPRPGFDVSDVILKLMRLSVPILDYLKFSHKYSTKASYLTLVGDVMSLRWEDGNRYRFLRYFVQCQTPTRG